MKIREGHWTPDMVRGLGVRTNLETANSILGLSRAGGYELALRGEYPVKVLKVGRKYIVPVAGLLAALDIPAEDNSERQLTA
ncbi:DNA-binding protein [Gordonia sp. CPCC 205515]|uniref:DNA-binding protein n=1 Tax=Gordonia sp. CPCC 205515 TaxID=3140791 RepID=UPI003AF3CD21